MIKVNSTISFEIVGDNYTPNQRLPNLQHLILQSSLQISCLLKWQHDKSTKSSQHNILGLRVTGKHNLFMSVKHVYFHPMLKSVHKLYFHVPHHSIDVLHHSPSFEMNLLYGLAETHVGSVNFPFCPCDCIEPTRALEAIERDNWEQSHPLTSKRFRLLLIALTQFEMNLLF